MARFRRDCVCVYPRPIMKCVRTSNAI
uniref:Uncharacterized protein n=1 Tax=Arundo donax TaxID=35708 RepID=A0A0A8ZDG2_ARUDO